MEFTLEVRDKEWPRHSLGSVEAIVLHQTTDFANEFTSFSIVGEACSEVMAKMAEFIEWGQEYLHLEDLFHLMVAETADGEWTVTMLPGRPDQRKVFLVLAEYKSKNDQLPRSVKGICSTKEKAETIVDALGLLHNIDSAWSEEWKID